MAPAPDRTDRVVLIAWAVSDVPTQVAEREPRNAGLEERLLPPGAAAPDFDLTTVDGTRLRLSDYRGNAVLLTFWRAG